MIDILLVEDDDDHIELARRVFEKHGVSAAVHTARGGTEALDFLFKGGQASIPATLQLILLDLNLPDISGLEVLRRLKSDALTRQIPVVVVSASKGEPDLLQSFHMGVQDYIVKPMTLERFKTLYNAHVQAPH